MGGVDETAEQRLAFIVLLLYLVKESRKAISPMAVPDCRLALPVILKPHPSFLVSRFPSAPTGSGPAAASHLRCR